MRTITFVTGLALLAMTPDLVGCTSARRTYTQQGQPAYSIKCSSGNWRNCLIKAGHICRSRGYDVVTSDEVEGLLVVACKAQQQPQSTVSGR